VDVRFSLELTLKLFPHDVSQSLGFLESQLSGKYREVGITFLVLFADDFSTGADCFDQFDFIHPSGIGPVVGFVDDLTSSVNLLVIVGVEGDGELHGVLLEGDVGGVVLVDPGVGRSLDHLTERADVLVPLSVPGVVFMATLALPDAATAGIPHLIDVEPLAVGHGVVVGDVGNAAAFLVVVELDPVAVATPHELALGHSSYPLIDVDLVAVAVRNPLVARVLVIDVGLSTDVESRTGELIAVRAFALVFGHGFEHFHLDVLTGGTGLTVRGAVVRVLVVELVLRRSRELPVIIARKGFHCLSITQVWPPNTYCAKEPPEVVVG